MSIGENKRVIYKKGFCNIDEGFVSACESEFEAELCEMVEELCHKKESRIIGLTGPTCSGKTTTAELLTDAFEAAAKALQPVP